MQERKLWLALGLLLIAVVARPVFGGDGVIEINQTRALKGGVGSISDTAGFPVSIVESGSYRLTSNLDVREEPNPENVHVIHILMGDVTIDLNGFSILGPTTCTGSDGASLMCSPVGTGRAIYTTSQGSVEIKNGSIVGSGGYGIWAASNASVSNVRIENSGNDGIDTIYYAVIDNVRATRNNGAGINVSRGTVRHCRADSNGWVGIRAADYSSVVRDSSAMFNGSYGMLLSSSSGYVGNVVYGNSEGTISQGVQLGPNLCDGSLCP